jgi:hypothetical protein
MKYLSSPLSFVESEDYLGIVSDINDKKTMLDNLVELIVFTRRGSFVGDPEFGFEYWSYEYSNFNDTDFNNNSTGRDEYYGEGAKARCQESIKRSLATYAPELKNVEVEMTLAPAEIDNQGNHKVHSRHVVVISVGGILESRLGTSAPYRKDIVFLMEPTAKRLHF